MRERFSPGQARRNVAIKLAEASTLAGKVVDEKGRPWRGKGRLDPRPAGRDRDSVATIIWWALSRSPA